MSCNSNPDKDVYVDGVYIGTSDENATIGMVGQKHLNHIIDSLREKSHADMVAEMLTPTEESLKSQACEIIKDMSAFAKSNPSQESPAKPIQTQPIGDFRLTQWDEFSKEVLSVCGRWKDNGSLPIIYKDDLNLSELAIPGPAKYNSIVRAMSILANLWESTFPEEQAIRYMHNFLAAVRTHIETYTIPRYSTGCRYSDPLCKFTLADIDTQLTKYVTRYGRMERGDERILDIKKMAHYYQVGWSLWVNQKETPDQEAIPEPTLECDTKKSLKILWHRVRNLEERVEEHNDSLLRTINTIINGLCALEKHVMALESRPYLTPEQEHFNNTHTPMNI